MKTSYTIEIDLDGNVVTTMTRVRTLEEYFAEVQKVHSFALSMRGHPVAGAWTLLEQEPDPNLGETHEG